MFLLRSCFVFLVALAATGCAGLTETRDFAATSALIAGDTRAAQDWAATHERERLLLTGADLELSKAEHAPRQDVLPELIQLHDTVAIYFATLAQLAGDEGNALGDAGNRSAKSLRQLKVPGLESQHVDAANKLAALVVSGYQQFQISLYVRDADAPLQQALAGMRQLIRVYQGTLRNELGRAGFLALTDPAQPNGPLLAALANLEHARITAGIERKLQRLIALDAALVKIADAHRTLARLELDVDPDESRTILRKVTRELVKLQNQLLNPES